MLQIVTMSSVFVAYVFHINEDRFTEHIIVFWFLRHRILPMLNIFLEIIQNLLIRQNVESNLTSIQYK